MRGQAALAPARGHDTGGPRPLHPVPLHHRRPDAGRGAGDAAAPRADQGRARSRGSSRKAIPPTRRRSAGSATPDDKVRRLCREGVAAGWRHFKLKVGRDLDEDVRRAAIVREEIGPDRVLMVDANQVWDVDEAIAWMERLAPFQPWWIEEPTSPDDVLGHARIARAMAPLGIGVATGEHCHNRVMFKQLFQADAIGIAQIDSCRLGGVNEVLAVLLLAAKFGSPGLPPCRRRRPVRVRPAPRDLRLHRRQRHHGRPRRGVRGPSARALRGPGRDPRRTVRRARRRPATASRCIRRRWPASPSRMGPPGRRTDDGAFTVVWRTRSASSPAPAPGSGGPRLWPSPRRARRSRSADVDGDAAAATVAEIAAATNGAATSDARSFIVDVTDPASTRGHGRGRRGRVGPDRRAVQQRRHRGRRARSTRPRSSCGTGSWRSTSAGSSSSPGRSLPDDDRGRPRVDHQHVVDHRRDRPRPAGLVRRVQGRRALADPPDAGRLRGARHPGQRPAARHHPHAVRGPLPRGELRRSGRGPGDRSSVAS